MNPAFLLLAGIDADRCADDRFPLLVGPFILHCEASGRVDRVRDWATGTDRTITLATESPVWSWDRGHLRIGTTGPQARWETFGPEGEQAVSTAPELVSSKAPIGAASSGKMVVLAFEDRLEISWDGGPVRTHVDGRPLPGHLAVGDNFAAWTERRGGRDVLAIVTPASMAVSSASNPVKFIDYGGRARMPVAAGDWLSWVDANGVNGTNPHGTTTGISPADTGFLHGLALARDNGRGELCWEDRANLSTGGDIDLACLTAGRISRPGHQFAPSLGMEGAAYTLLFREGDRVWLAQW